MVELAVATGKYPNIIASDAALRKIRREMAAVVSGERRSTWLIMGDSTQSGRGSGDGGADANWENGARAKSPSAVMASLLNGRGIAARADAWIGRQGAFPATTAHYTEYNPDVVFGANWADDASGALGGSMFSLNSPNTTAITYTPKRAADRFDVLYPRGSGFAAITVSDSGGTLTGGSIDQNGTNAMLLGATTRASASTTAISIARASGGRAYVNGVLPWNSTLPEVSIVNAGVSGWTASNLMNTGQFYRSYYGIAAVDADMYYIEMGLNEANTGVSLSTFATNLEAVVDYCLSLGGDGSVILGISAPGSSGYALSSDWRNTISDMARDKDVALVDHFARFVSFASDSSLYVDTVHLTAPGSAIKGGLMAQLAGL